MEYGNLTYLLTNTYWLQNIGDVNESLNKGKEWFYLFCLFLNHDLVHFFYRHRHFQFNIFIHHIILSYRHEARATTTVAVGLSTTSLIKYSHYFLRI
jgi:hypothetical protein